jgi:hypothetical protein
VGRKAQLSPVIRAYPRSGRLRQDRPVTPAVAGSTPVAPVSEVLVVARIGDDRAVVRATRSVLEAPASLNLQLDVVGRIVQRLVGDGAGTVDLVEIQRGRAEAASLLRVRRLRESRGRVEGDVMVGRDGDAGGGQARRRPRRCPPPP